MTPLGDLEPNGSLVVEMGMDKSAGSYWHQFGLSDVPANCVVQGLNPTAEDSLTFGDTLDVLFPVACSPSDGR